MDKAQYDKTLAAITKAFKTALDEEVSLRNLLEVLEDAVDWDVILSEYDTGSYCASCGDDADGTYAQVMLSNDPDDMGLRYVTRCCEAELVTLREKE